MYQRIERGAVNLQVKQLIAVEVQGDIVACAQRDGAHICLDHATVIDPRAQQGDAAGFSGLKTAFVDDLCL